MANPRLPNLRRDRFQSAVEACFHHQTSRYSTLPKPSSGTCVRATASHLSMFTFYDGIVNVLAEQSVSDLCEMFYIEIRICHAVKQCRGVQHAIAISTALQESITACHYFLTLRKIFQTLLNDQTVAVI